MRHPLDDANAKVARAIEHLKELDSKAFAFANDHPYRVGSEINADSGRLEFVARAVGKEEPVPIEFGIIAGDIAHNLRSALNYLTWYLASQPIGSGPGDATQFPIYFDHAGRDYKKAPSQRFQDGQNGYLQGVPTRYRAVIERMQPYHGGHRQHLAFLAALNNRDKHQVVTTMLMLGHIGPPDVEHGTSKGLTIMQYPTPAIYHGAVVGYVIDFGEAQPDVNMKFSPTFEVGFGDNPMIGGVWHFARLTRLITLILRVFRDAV
jgi:hypothetical protein